MKSAKVKSGSKVKASGRAPAKGKTLSARTTRRLDAIAAKALNQVEAFQKEGNVLLALTALQLYQRTTHEAHTPPPLWPRS